MGSLYCFLPGPPGTIAPDCPELLSRGLDGLVDLPSDFRRDGYLTHVAAGPGGVAGMIRVFGAPEGFDQKMAAAMFDAGSCEWGVETPIYSLGWLRGQRPGPAELRREYQVTSQPVKLADGNEWQIPVANWLPKAPVVDPYSRQLVGDRVFTEYRALQLLATAFREATALHADLAAAALPWSRALAKLALATNYRLTDPLIDALGLLPNLEAIGVSVVASGIDHEVRMANAAETLHRMDHRSSNPENMN